MPHIHVRDDGVTTYVTWYELTSEEREAVAEFVESLHDDLTTSVNEIALKDCVGPSASPGTNLWIPLYTDTQPELPDKDVIESQIESILLDAGIAGYISRVEIPADPAGEIYHSTDEDDPTDKAYRALIKVGGGWEKNERIEH